MSSVRAVSKQGASFVLSKAFLFALLVNTVWINASEVFRYFVFVMPMMREALPGVGNVALMDLIVFASWGVWDTILVVVSTSSIWVMYDRFGSDFRTTLLAATGLWLGVFVILWLGLYKMNLATLEIILVALPLAWLEMVVAALIVRSFWGTSTAA